MWNGETKAYPQSKEAKTNKWLAFLLSKWFINDGLHNYEIFLYQLANLTSQPDVRKTKGSQHPRTYEKHPIPYTETVLYSFVFSDTDYYALTLLIIIFQWKHWRKILCNGSSNSTDREIRLQEQRLQESRFTSKACKHIWLDFLLLLPLSTLLCLLFFQANLKVLHFTSNTLYGTQNAVEGILY